MPDGVASLKSHVQSFRLSPKAIALRAGGLDYLVLILLAGEDTIQKDAPASAPAAPPSNRITIDSNASLHIDAQAAGAIEKPMQLPISAQPINVRPLFPRRRVPSAAAPSDTANVMGQ